MKKTNLKVDPYFVDGCGRCPLGGTPQCKVRDWQAQLKRLREIILECGLTEELKWGVPCYTYRKNNVVLLSALKEYCCVSFLKGALLNDPAGILQKPGENTQAGRLIRFTDLQEIDQMETILKQYINNAIAIEKAGKKVTLKKNPEPMPEELQYKMDSSPEFKTAFEALTPGRQRGYILYFSAAKQSTTRQSRIEKCAPRIFEGKGMHD